MHTPRNGGVVGGEGKLLKVCCLVALFAGLGTCAFGAVLVGADLADADAWVTTGEGLLSTVFGVRTAVLANVPSNTARIRTKALALTLVAAAAIAFLVLVGQDVQVAQHVLAGLIAGIGLVTLVVAARIVREQLRK